jgi:hypothetical protein
MRECLFVNRRFAEIAHFQVARLAVRVFALLHDVGISYSESGITSYKPPLRAKRSKRV